MNTKVKLAFRVLKLVIHDLLHSGSIVFGLLYLVLSFFNSSGSIAEKLDSIFGQNSMKITIIIICVILVVRIIYVVRAQYKSYSKYKGISASDMFSSKHKIYYVDKEKIVQLILGESERIFSEIKIKECLPKYGKWVFQYEDLNHLLISRRNNEIKIEIGPNNGGSWPDSARNFERLKRIESFLNKEGFSPKLES